MDVMASCLELYFIKARGQRVVIGKTRNVFQSLFFKLFDTFMNFWKI